MSVLDNEGHDPNGLGNTPSRARINELQHFCDAQAAEIERLRAALEHMRWCRHCAEGGWEDCEGGREALAALGTTGQTEGEEKKWK